MLPVIIYLESIIFSIKVTLIFVIKLREGNVKMITSYAAKPGQKEAQDFTYEVLYKGKKPKKANK